MHILCMPEFVLVFSTLVDTFWNPFPNKSRSIILIASLICWGMHLVSLFIDFRFISICRSRLYLFSINLSFSKYIEICSMLFMCKKENEMSHQNFTFNFLSCRHWHFYAFLIIPDSLLDIKLAAVTRFLFILLNNRSALALCYKYNAQHILDWKLVDEIFTIVLFYFR